MCYVCVCICVRERVYVRMYDCHSLVESAKATAYREHAGKGKAVNEGEVGL